MSISTASAWLLARLSEASTWAGIAAACGAIAATLQSGAGLTAAVAAGAVAVLIPDKGAKS